MHSHLRKRETGKFFEVLKDAGYLLPQDARNAVRRLVLRKKYIKKLKKLSSTLGYTYAPYMKHQSIFVHIPKTGGVSVSKALFGNLAGGHSTVGNYQGVFNKKDYESMFKFTFVRNPWSRLYSAYKFLRTGGLKGKDPEWTGEDLETYKSFSDFVENGLALGKVSNYVHFFPQTKFLCLPFSNKLRVDFIGMFENIDSDFETVCDTLGLGYVDLPHLNSGLESRRDDYRQAYTSRARHIVAKIYKKDIECFGYDFDGKNIHEQITRRSGNVYGKKSMFR